jgi:hypothetical protein
MVKRTFLLGVALFVLAVAFSLRLDGMADGYTTVGFPVTFLKYTGGKCDGCDQYFDWLRLGVDILSAMTAAVCFVKVRQLMT